MVENGVTAYFHGHDHQYAYEIVDGIVYQEVPSPGMTGSGFNLYSENDPNTIRVLPNSGHLRVTISPNQDLATVDYVRSDSTVPGTNGQVTYSYAMEAAGMALVPEIDLRFNGISIADGDMTPSTTDGTIFGSQNVASGSVTRTFTIVNTGSGTLNLTGSPVVEIIGNNPGDSLSPQPQHEYSTRRWVNDFQRDVRPYGRWHAPPPPSGSRTTTATRLPYYIDLQGTGTTAVPEIDVRFNGISIADGDMTPSTADGTIFGSQNVASGSLTRTFTIVNTGSGTLNLLGSPLVEIIGINPGDFLVTMQPSAVLRGARRLHDI